MEMRELVVKKGGCPMPYPLRSIEFVNVGVSVNKRIVLRNLNFMIRAGDKVAITGENGVGKTSIFRVLLGFSSYEGNVFINDTELLMIDKVLLRDEIAYVPQEPNLLDGTVWENLSYGNRRKSRDEVIHLCKKCGVHALFKGLDRGYDTLVGEGGRYLSGGQCQLLNFMRAVVKDSPILVLDEPTSNLDATESAKLLNLIFTILCGKTVVYTTHRVSDLIRFQRVLYVGKTGIEERQGNRSHGRVDDVV
jgi:ABC-type multidrug transport system fused ATPase/permease subunit